MFFVGSNMWHNNIGRFKIIIIAHCYRCQTLDFFDNTQNVLPSYKATLKAGKCNIEQLKESNDKSFV